MLHKNSNNKDFLLKISHFVIALIIFIFTASMLNQSPWENYRIEPYTGTDGFVEPAWTLYKDGKVIEENISFPYYMKLQADHTYVVSATITYDPQLDNAPYMFFKAKHIFCKAYIDDEEIFNYTHGKIHSVDKAKSPGSIYTFVPLPRDCKGKTFTITFTPSLDAPIEYKIPEAVFGDYPTVMHKIFISNLPIMVLSMISMFLGISVVLFSSFALKGSVYREGIFIGIFAIIFGVYNFTQCTLIHTLVQNPYYTYMLKYCSFTMMAIFLLAFLREYFDGKRKVVCTIMTLISVVALFLQSSLHFNGICDVRELLPFLQVIYIADIIINFAMILTMKPCEKKKSMIIQWLPVAAGITADIILYNAHLNNFGSDAFFTTLGVLVFLMLEAREVWHASISIYSESMRSKKYRDMAYLDKLTSIGNRRAYEFEKKKIADNEIIYDSLTVISIDVNNLKTINDTLGHSSGDSLIKSTADILNDITEGCGKAFRTGGDEFFGFCYNISQDEFNAKLDKAHKDIKKLNSEHDIQLSVALGYETIEDNDIEAALESADQKMYEDKRRIKEKLKQEIR